MFTTSQINDRLDAAVTAYNKSSTRIYSASVLYVMGGGKPSEMRDRLKDGGVSWFSKAVTVATNFAEPFKSLNDDWASLTIAAAEKVIEAEIERKVLASGSLNAMYYRAQSKLTPREVEAVALLAKVAGGLRQSIDTFEALHKVAPDAVKPRLIDASTDAAAAADAADAVTCPTDKREQVNLATLADAAAAASAAADIAAATIEAVKSPIDPDEKVEADDAAAATDDAASTDAVGEACSYILTLTTAASLDRIEAALAEARAKVAAAAELLAENSGGIDDDAAAESREKVAATG